MRGARRTEAHLELVHDGYNLVLESLVRHLTSPEVNLVADQDDRHL